MQPDVNIGSKVGKYSILHPFGGDELYELYLAEQQFIKRKVVLKFFKTKEKDLLALAYQEANLIASIDHPYIVRLYDADEFDGWFYLVFEYVDGKNLAEMITAKDKVPIQVALRLMIDIAEALEYTHQLGIVHGDIKPENIMVSPKGVPVLIDFFASAAIFGKSPSKAIVGTPEYLSPEGWRGKPETRSDIWSLGMTFLNLLTGHLPFEYIDRKSIIQTVSSEEPLDLSSFSDRMPNAVAQILEKCLKKSLAQRYQSVSELRRDCEAALERLGLYFSKTDTDSTSSLRSGITIMLNVEYKEPGIAGHYREYRIGKALGRGNFSYVFQAEDVIGKKQVALKVLRQELVHDKRILTRFRREADLLARLEHPHLVHVYNYGQYSRNYFLVMEILQGPTLRQVLNWKKPFQLEETIATISQILLGLERLHSEKVVHRDLKPDNIKLLPERVVVMDLGLAHISSDTRLTRSGEMFGTPRYMSPEQARGETITFQSDLYATGILLYELLTGSIPYETENLADLIYKIIIEEPEPIKNHRQDLPLPLVNFLERILAKEPINRFSSTSLAYHELLASVGLKNSDVLPVYSNMVKKSNLMTWGKQ